ncbi:MAG: transposase [Candidatus Endonucleobacter sp. (ex Gigantidas childressi)]|nr:transposase [Candidatus Endonucleobacter sp. (ex Gigantidas childressi)]
MLKITLTSQQKTNLELRHKKMRDVRRCYRIKVVLLKSEDWPVSTMAKALRNSESSINSYLNDCLKKGKLTPENGGSKSGLNDEKMRQLIDYISEEWGVNYLPPYSPNLNPIEQLWKVLNKHSRNNEYFVTTKEFRQKTNHFFYEAIPKIGASLINRVNDNVEMMQPAY